MSIGPGEYIDPQTASEQYLPRDELGLTIPQPEYAVIYPDRLAELEHPACLSVADYGRLLPVAFETTAGRSEVGVLTETGGRAALDLGNLSGITYHGVKPADDGRALPVFSFLYSNGKTESAERVVAAQAFGNGVLHPGHTGQHSCPYIVGLDIGRRDPQTGKIVYFDPVDHITEHFAMSCIWPGDHPNWEA